MITLIRQLQAFSPMSPDLVNHFYEIVEQKETEKKSYLLKAGKICQNVYYIKKGLIRCYLKGKEEEEITTWFMKEGDIIMLPASLYKQSRNRQYIQCLEKCELFYISRSQLDSIYEHYPEFNLTGRLITQKYNALLSRYNYITRIRRMEERYRHFLDHFPDLANRVPAKAIASFLGMSVYHFSRLRHAGHKSNHCQPQ